ncbi:MAG: hypothetical protein OEQ49_16510 [Myxococcales bacterium]|nr:hypothetical protein [Myxococcales bacterium]
MLREVWAGATAAVAVAAYVFPYLYLPGVWWRAIPSTCVILFVGAMFYGRETLTFFGVKLSSRELAVSVGLFFILLPACWYLIFSVVVVEPVSAHLNAYPPAQIHQFFQVLNDEIVLRAALLTLLLRAFPYPKTVIILTAALFSVGHHLLYGLNGVDIEWPAMVSLFSFGAIANALFVRYRHIGYGLALHYAWNFYRFNSTYSLDGRVLSEGMTFNVIEGNAWVAVGSSMALVLVFVGYWHVEQTSEQSKRSELA